MAITTEVTKSLGNGFTQVDSTNKFGYKRYYKVPDKNAKTFAVQLKQQDKNLNLYSNIVFFLSIFAGVFGAFHFTKKVESRLKKFLIQTGSAIGLATLTSLGFNEYALNREINLLKKHNAKEIFYKTI